VILTRRLKSQIEKIGHEDSSFYSQVGEKENEMTDRILGEIALTLGEIGEFDSLGQV
jgi:hypothetical protein